MTLTATQLLLPPRLYACVGAEMNLYFDACLTQPARFDILSGVTGGDPSRQQEERWTLTPGAANIGDHLLTVRAWAGVDLIAERTLSVTVRPVTPSTPTPRRIVAIGDSITSGGQWLAELINLGALAGWTLTPTGKRSISTADAGGTARTVQHEGVGGKTIAWHYSDPASSFVFGGVFDFAQFKASLGGAPVCTVNPAIATTAQTCHTQGGDDGTWNGDGLIAAGDWVLIMLGVNDVFGYSDDVSCLVAIAAMSVKLGTMIANIRASAPGVRIGVCTPIPPAQSQDAFGHDYGAGQTRWRYRRNHDLWVDYLLTTYAVPPCPDVFLVPTHLCLDTARNMQTEADAVTTRHPQAVVRQSNGVHPASAGQWQIADCVFAFLRGNEP